MNKIKAYYQCPKCKRESCIVRLDKRCVFCEYDNYKTKEKLIKLAEQEIAEWRLFIENLRNNKNK